MFLSLCPHYADKARTARLHGPQKHLVTLDFKCTMARLVPREGVCLLKPCLESHGTRPSADLCLRANSGQHHSHLSHCRESHSNLTQTSNGLDRRVKDSCQNSTVYHRLPFIPEEKVNCKAEKTKSLCSLVFDAED